MVASHIYLILLPVVLDLLLWFGPHLRVKALLEPALVNMISTMQQSTAVEMRPVLDNLQSVWRLFLEQYNLLSLLSTFPIGVPSMMSGDLPTHTPLGLPMQIEIGSFGQLVLGGLACSLIGLTLGSIYFASIAHACHEQMPEPDCDLALVAKNHTPAFRPGVIAWQTLQSLALVILLSAILLIVLIPSVIMTSFLALISVAVAQIALLLISFSVLWLLVPMAFSPHGIYLCGLSVINALITSARIVRHSLSGTGFFLLATIILYQGMNILWHFPVETSWMRLVGIIGNAFIVSGLLAASFFYYRAGLAYVQAVSKQVAVQK